MHECGGLQQECSLGRPLPERINLERTAALSVIEQRRDQTAQIIGHRHLCKRADARGDAHIIPLITQLAVLPPEDLKAQRGRADMHEPHFAAQRMARRDRRAEIDIEMHEGRAEIALDLKAKPVEASVMQPPRINRLKPEIGNAPGIGDLRGIAIAPCHLPCVNKPTLIADATLSQTAQSCPASGSIRFDMITALLAHALADRGPIHASAACNIGERSFDAVLHRFQSANVNIGLLIQH